MMVNMACSFKDTVLTMRASNMPLVVDLRILSSMQRRV